MRSQGEVDKLRGIKTKLEGIQQRVTQTASVAKPLQDLVQVLRVLAKEPETLAQVNRGQ